MRLLFRLRFSASALIVGSALFAFVRVGHADGSSPVPTTSQPVATASDPAPGSTDTSQRPCRCSLTYTTYDLRGNFVQSQTVNDTMYIPTERTCDSYDQTDFIDLAGKHLPVAQLSCEADD